MAGKKENPMRLDGKTILVTGAGRGLGWGIARAFGRAGASVCISDVNEPELARAAADLRGDDSRVLALPLDVADLAAFQATVAQVVQQWGRLDVLVHNAIYMPLITFEETSPEEWQRQIQVGLGGLFNATRAAWEVMKAQGGGHIMGVASGSSVRGYRRESAYCTIKHGQEGFMKALALEAAPYRIAINSLGPGKPVKPTRITWAELDALPPEVKAGWADPAELGRGFVWLACQPPERFSGYRFDAGVIADSIAREGSDFAFDPRKVTMYPEDFVARQAWYAGYKD
jgi:NAD(P)-dependent dehydrogenase (short-subunit alcohol dehydrogenase family)